jgi:hypothetical protein
MVHFFRAGPDLVLCNLTELERGGHCQLTVYHASGTIVEYFQTAAMAVRRMQELEDLLVRARGFDGLAPLECAS